MGEEEVKRGLGNNTVFLAQGRFLGDTRWAATDGLPPTICSSLAVASGEFDLNLMRDLALETAGDCSDRMILNRPCFSFTRLACISVFSRADDLFVLRAVMGVVGSVVLWRLLMAAAAAAVTASFVVRLASRISTTVSPSSMAGSDIRRHSPVRRRVLESTL